MFSCRDATNLVTEESEGALAGRGRFMYRLHMTICPYCKAFRRQLEETIAVAKEIPRENVAPGAEVEERLAEAFRARRRG
jgi:hypothetical protein